MSRTSIGITPKTKRVLGAAKPDGMHWDEFLATLLRAVDTTLFLDFAESRHIATEAEAVDRARARYRKYQETPEALISGAELRRRIHMRRLMDSLDSFYGSIRLASENGATMDSAAVESALNDLDSQIHTTRDVLTVVQLSVAREIPLDPTPEYAVVFAPEIEKELLGFDAIDALVGEIEKNLALRFEHIPGRRIE